MANENFNTEEEVGIDEVLDEVEESYRDKGSKGHTSREESSETATEEASEETADAAEEEKKEEDDKASDEKGADDSDQEQGEAVTDKAPKKDKKDTLIEELNDKVKRQLAEFENFRKRSEKEKSQMFDMGAKAIIEKILPVIDNFERGLAGIPEDNTEDAFAEGMRMVYKQMTTALEQAGLTPIEAVGQTFDPEIHNAVMHIDDEAYGESEIVEEMQKGYKYHDTVVRHSMVKVAN